MFAVIKTGGKQYKVVKDDQITIERLVNGAGDTVQFSEVLMLGGDDGVTVGKPLIADAAVQGEVVDLVRAEKVYTFKKRRRKHGSKRIRGHRQHLTVVKITDILPSGGGKSGVAEAQGAGQVIAAATAAAATAAE